MALITRPCRATSVCIVSDGRLTTIDPRFRPFFFDRWCSFPSHNHRIRLMTKPGIRAFMAVSISLMMAKLSASLPPSIRVRNGTPSTSTGKSCRRILKSVGCRIFSATSLWDADWTNTSVSLLRIWRIAYAPLMCCCAFVSSSCGCKFCAPSILILTAVFAICGATTDA